MQTVSQPGYPLGWSSMVEPYAYRATATARAHTRLLAFPRDVLEEYADKNPEFGQALMRTIIGLVGDRVRAIRLQLIARRYHDDVTAVRQLLRDSDDVLPLFSPLHKLPHYLENRLTLDDAFHMLDVVRVRGDPAERPWPKSASTFWATFGGSCSSINSSRRSTAASPMHRLTWTRRSYAGAA